MTPPPPAPQIVYLLRDLDDRVQSTAIETAGLLRTKEALPSLRAIVNSPRNARADDAPRFPAIAMMPDQSDHALLASELGSKDEKIAHTAGLEGSGPSEQSRRRSND